MSSTSDSLGRRAGRALTRLVVTLVVLGLLGVVGLLLSQLNARTFTLQQTDGKLVILKGRMLPVGADPYRRPTRRSPQPTPPSTSWAAVPPGWRTRNSRSAMPSTARCSACWRASP